MKSDQPIQLREATIKDAAAVLSLLHDLSHATGMPGKVYSSADDIEEAIFSDHSFVHAILAELEETPVGLSLYYPIFSSWRGENGVYILDLYVDESLRGSGLGRRLISATAKEAKNKWHSKFMCLDVDKDNDQAFAFYNQLGFEHSQEDHKMVALSSAYTSFLQN